MWLPIHDFYDTAKENVAAQEAEEHSFLNNFRQLVTLERKKVVSIIRFYITLQKTTWIN